MALYDIGDTIKLTFTVRVDNVLTDATLTTLTVTKPDGTNVSPAPTVTHTGTGTYTSVIALDAAGQWVWKWVATGPAGVAMTAEDGSFDVQPSVIPTLYATVGEIQDELGDDVNMSQSVGLLEKAVRATSRAIDKWCGRRFWLDTTPVARTFSVNNIINATRIVLPDVGSKTGFVLATGRQTDGSYPTIWDATSYVLWPFNADANGGAYSWTELRTSGSQLPLPVNPGYPTVQVTARWGWSQIPPPINEACILKAVSLFKRKDAPFGVAGFDQYGAIRITRQDPDVMDLLQPFERVGFGSDL